jgi:putative ABC transport system permease protein
MRSWLVALRIARREARRAKGRTLLIVAMIALPVAALSFAAASYDMYRLTPQERVTREMGAADAFIDWSGGVPSSGDGTVPNTATAASELLTHLPASSHLVPFWSTGVGMHTAYGYGSLNAYGLDVSDPITRGLVRIDSGRAPRADNEVLVSPAALDRLGTHVGGVIRTVTDSYGSKDALHGLFPAQTYTVVGVGEIGGDLQEYIVFRPSQDPDAASWLVSTPGPVTEYDVTSLRQLGATVKSRELTLHPPAAAPTTTSNPTVAGFSVFGIGTLIIGLGLLEVVLLAGPAFAVGARRRQRDLALVATSGGTPATLRRIVLADGVVGGAVAAVVGLAAGLATAALGRPAMEDHLAHMRLGAFRVYPAAVAGVIGLALITGLAGALLPAISAGRQDVVAALTGRRGAVRSRRLWVVVGAIGIVVGAVITVAGAYWHDSTIVLTGLVSGEFGIVLCTPTILGAVARLGRFLPVSPRIALRDSARRRSAAAPAISAVMAAVAGSVALTVYLGANSNRGTAYEPGMLIGSVAVSTHLGPEPDAVRADEVRRIIAIVQHDLPGSTSVVIDSVDYTRTGVMPTTVPSLRCPYDSAPSPLSAADQRRAAADPRCSMLNMGTSVGSLSPIVTVDPAVLAGAYGLSGHDLDAAVSALKNGWIVVNDPRTVDHGRITLTIDDTTADGNNSTERTATEPAYTLPHHFATTIAMSPATAAALHLIPAPSVLVLTTPLHAPTIAQTDALEADLSNANLSGAGIQQGPPHDSQTVAIILAVAAAIIALGAAAISTGLAAVDGRGDLRTLGAVGATPRVRRMLALSQSGVIAGLGSVLGAIAGFGAGAAVVFGLNQVYAGRWPAPIPYPIVVPWLNLGVSVLAVPLVAMLGAGLLTRSRLPIERRPD